jgi:hypothetical protein
MKMLVTVLIYLVCILLAMSLSQETAQALFPGTRGMSIVSNVNFISIPPPPPPLNCDDVDEKDFTVFPPDPHGFDRDKGGESCETSE